MCEYELSTNVPNFTKKDTAEAKLLLKVLREGGGLLYFESTYTWFKPLNLPRGSTLQWGTGWCMLGVAQ